MKKYALVLLVAVLGLMVAAPAASSANTHSRVLPKTRQALNALLSKRKAGGFVPASAVLKAHASKKKKKCKKGYTKNSKGKCVKKKPAYVPPPPPPPPLALTESEVTTQVVKKAFEYCLPDQYCYDWGYYVDYSGGRFRAAQSRPIAGRAMAGTTSTTVPSTPVTSGR